MEEEQEWMSTQSRRPAIDFRLIGVFVEWWEGIGRQLAACARENGQAMFATQEDTNTRYISFDAVSLWS
jgi:hypothetical protein